MGAQQFTHYAGWQAFMAIRNFALPSSSRGVSEIVPRVTFTDPEIAAVGMTEEEFLAKFGDDGKVITRYLPHVDRAVCEREEEDGFFKIMFTKNQKVRMAGNCARAAWSFHHLCRSFLSFALSCYLIPNKLVGFCCFPARLPLQLLPR